MNEVLLCSTLHDPDGVFANVLKKTSMVVLEGYRGWVVNVTPKTNERIKNILWALAPYGVLMTETDTSYPIVTDQVENDHLFLIKQAIFYAGDQGVSKMQYTDGDRIITAATHFPEYLMKMAARASNLLGNSSSYVNFRRSPEDYFTHHPPLVQTEFEFNRLYSRVFGIPIDIASTAHGMSLDVMEKILYRSPQMETVSFPHPKWLLIAREMGAPIQSEEIERVLTFETPDQFRDQVDKQIGGALEHLGLPEPTTVSTYEKLRSNYMATIGRESTYSRKEWENRFIIAKQYLSLLRGHLNIFDYNNQAQIKLSKRIKYSLDSIERLASIIKEALPELSDPKSK
jgi:hypothetical protein